MGLFDEIMEAMEQLSSQDHRSKAERGKLVGCGQRFPFEKTCLAPTAAGFAIRYRLLGRIYQKDKTKPDRKLWQADYDRVCRKVDALVVQPVFGPSRFFVLGWKAAETPDIEQPAVFLCEFTIKNERPYIKIHEDFTELVDE